MKYLPNSSIPLFLVAVAATSACKERNNPPSDQPSGKAPKTAESLETAKYPRLYQKYLDSGSEVESAMPFDWPANTKILQLFEESFRIHIQFCKPKDESSFAIQRSKSDTLSIQFSPQAVNDSRAMIAVWVRREKGDEGNSTILRRVSPPLSSKEEALLLLKSYASGEGNLENLLEWKES